MSPEAKTVPPLVSIVMVVKNNREGLLKCFERYRLLPDRSGLEVIVIDGASTDGTPALLAENADLVDSFLSEADTGIYDAMNKGILLSNGRYVLLINTDDLLIPDSFAEALKTLRHSSSDIVAFGARMTAHGKTRYVRHPRQLDECMMFRTMPFSHNAAFIAKALYEHLGVYRTDLRIVSDLSFLYRAFKGSASVQIVDEILIDSELTGLSGSNPSLLEAENIHLLAEIYPYLSSACLQTLYRFRLRHAGASIDLSYSLLGTCIVDAQRRGDALGACIRKCINEAPMRFVDAGLLSLVRLLPRDGMARAFLDKNSDPASRTSVAEPPLVTIGVPTFNCQETLPQTIASLLTQNYPHYEILCVDDASQDATRDILKTYKQPNFRHAINTVNRGVAYTRNLIAEMAKGEYIMFCDDDDISFSNRLDTCLECLLGAMQQKGARNVACFTSRTAIAPSGERTFIEAAACGGAADNARIVDYVCAHLMRVCGKTGLFAGLPLASPFSMGTGVGMYPTQFLRRVGFHELFRRAEDLEFILAAASSTEPCYVIGLKDALYEQQLTTAPDKSKDAVFGYYILLLAMYSRALMQSGLDLCSVANTLAVRVKDPSFKHRLSAMFRREMCLTQTNSAFSQRTADSE